MGSMLEMLEQQATGKKPGEQPGNQPGDSKSGGTTDEESETEGGGKSNAKTAKRRLPKKGGINSETLPDEYRKVIEAYNKKVTK